MSAVYNDNASGLKGLGFRLTSCGRKNRHIIEISLVQGADESAFRVLGGNALRKFIM